MNPGGVQRRAVRARRGVASLEIVLALPVFVIALAGVFFMFRRAEARHQALQMARACAWDFALHSCDIDAVSLCAGISTHRGKGVPSDASVFGTISDIPILGAALDALFGEPASADVKLSYGAFMASDSVVSERAARTLVCAPVAESLGERVKGALCDLAKQKIGVEIYGCP